jgi:type III secretion protein C
MLASSSTTRGVPSFAADPRTNSVVVRDIASRIGQYEAMIRRLDERPRVVELEANIVEINSDQLAALGIDWRLTGRRAQLDVGGGTTANPVVAPGGVAPPTPIGNDPTQTIGSVAGAVLSIVAGSRVQLLARIAALEETGQASMSAQPKVTTLNNVEAALDAKSTFYVPVQGFQDAQLFEVSAGTSIRITPSVVSPEPGSADAARDAVRLLIKIEDGGFTGQNIGQLPVVQRTTVSTQSIINDSSTLLIAGYAQERDSRIRRGVPGLSKIPVLGNLFKSDENTRTRVERLFMITPRVVELRNAEMAPTAQLLPTVGASAASSAQPVPDAPLLPVPGTAKR